MSDKLILVNDAVNGLTALRLNETDGGSWSVASSPEYLSLPLNEEKINSFGTLIYS